MSEKFHSNEKYVDELEAEQAVGELIETIPGVKTAEKTIAVDHEKDVKKINKARENAENSYTATETETSPIEVVINAAPKPFQVGATGELKDALGWLVKEWKISPEQRWRKWYNEKSVQTHQLPAMWVKQAVEEGLIDNPTNEEMAEAMRAAIADAFDGRLGMTKTEEGKKAKLRYINSSELNTKSYLGQVTG